MCDLQVLKRVIRSCRRCAGTPRSLAPSVHIST
jgi:hypothetical protein